MCLPTAHTGTVSACEVITKENAFLFNNTKSNYLPFDARYIFVILQRNFHLQDINLKLVFYKNIKDLKVVLKISEIFKTSYRGKCSQRFGNK